MNRSIATLVILFSVMISACTKSQSSRKELDTSFLKLGQLGEIKSESVLSPDRGVHKITQAQIYDNLNNQGMITLTLKGLEAAKVGDLLVGPEENSFLLEITKLRVSGDYIILKTKLASLSDLAGGNNDYYKITATPDFSEVQGQLETTHEDTVQQNTWGLNADFEKGALVIRDQVLIDLDAEAALQLQYKESWFKKGGTLKGLNLKKGSRGGVKVIINELRAKVVPTFQTEYKFSGRKPTLISSRTDFHVEYLVDISVHTTGSAQLDFSADLIVPKKWPIWVQAGAVPVYSELELALPAGLKLSSSKQGEMRYRYHAEYSLMGELNYTDTQGLKTQSKQDAIVHEKSLTQADQANRSVEFYLEPRTTLRIYRVVGPYGYLHPYVRAEMQEPLQLNKKEILVGVGGGLGMQITDPVLLYSLMDLQSDFMFDWQTGWDLFGPQDPTQKPHAKDIPAKELAFDSIPTDGLFAVDLRELGDDQAQVRYNIIKPPQEGLLLPAPGGFSSGLFYYQPLNRKAGVELVRYQRVVNGVAQPEQRLQFTIAEKLVEQISQREFSPLSENATSAFESIESRGAFAPTLHVNKAVADQYTSVGQGFAVQSMQRVPRPQLRDSEDKIYLLAPAKNLSRRNNSGAVDFEMRPVTLSWTYTSEYGTSVKYSIVGLERQTDKSWKMVMREQAVEDRDCVFNWLFGSRSPQPGDCSRAIDNQNVAHPYPYYLGVLVVDNSCKTTVFPEQEARRVYGRYERTFPPHLEAEVQKKDRLVVIGGMNSSTAVLSEVESEMSEQQLDILSRCLR